MKSHTERNSTLCSVKEEKFYYSMVNARTDYGKRRECGMGTNDISGWENVYSSMGKINFLSHNEKNLKFYRNIEAEQYETWISALISGSERGAMQRLFIFSLKKDYFQMNYSQPV